MPLMMDNTTLNSSAHQKLSTLKPFTRLLAHNTISALITSRNKPIVITVTGKVRITSTGFTIRLSRPSTMASMSAVVKSYNFTPGKT